MSDDDLSNVPVEVRLLRVQPVIGRGTLKWLFDVQIDIQGVEIEVRDSKAERGAARFPSVRRNSVVAMGDGCRR